MRAWRSGMLCRLQRDPQEEGEGIVRAALVAGIVGALLFLPGSPAGARDVAGARDYPGMSRFAGSSLIGNQMLRFDAFVLPTGPVKQDESFQWQLTEKLDLE